MSDALPLPLPVQIKGTKMDHARVTGPPSYMLPRLRDIATGTVDVNPALLGKAYYRGPQTVKPVITIEVDLANHRYTGRITGYAPSPDRLWLHEEGCRAPRAVKFADILAFRVLEVKIDPETQVES